MYTEGNPLYENPTKITIEAKDSLVHVGSLDSFDITKGGIKAGKLLLSYLDNGDKKSLHKAIEIYEKIIPDENFGGEYTALEWLCKLLLTPEKEREELLSQPLVRSFYNVLSKDNFADLKQYIQLKYHIVEIDKNDIETKKKLRFLEDFILFNNPDRERWEKTRENMEKFNIRPGERIADVGSGPGYFSFKFGDIVGEEGKVYAIETNPMHLDFLRRHIEENGIKNVDVVVSQFEGIGLDKDVRVDTVFICSLYHNVYAAFTDFEREQFVGSIRNALVDGGKLIIVDNDLVDSEELPYHGPYISKALLTSQLYYYGFKLKDDYQFTPQRYVLIYEKTDIPENTKPIPNSINDPCNIHVNAAGSLIRYRIIGTSTAGYTIRGKACGKVMYEGFINNDPALIQKAHDMFAALWPQERIGDDYTAFMWFCEHYLADEAGKQAMLSDLRDRAYFDFFGGNDYERLKKYLYIKFYLEHQEDEDANIETSFEYDGKDFPIATLNEWNEYFVFNNPNRCLWEKTDQMLKLFDIREGESIADLGCGGGYFTYEFSKLVGDSGKVFATEINKDAMKYLDAFRENCHIKNIHTIVTKMDDCKLKEDSCDKVFMCSMYHAVYITDIEFVKDDFIASIQKGLKQGGKLIIVDNDVTDRDTPAYYGPGIMPELIISQLSFYGFKLIKKEQLIPQRFVLIFELEEKIKVGERKNGDKKRKHQQPPQQ
ncbi:MAG: methyltransferase domain-containing protein [Clostridia bacterium]|nr:methyltransferase domain-containing protein [Clostridia bacterium]